MGWDYSQYCQESGPDCSIAHLVGQGAHGHQEVGLHPLVLLQPGQAGGVTGVGGLGATSNYTQYVK